jgi:6-phosphofructokinase 1
MRIALLTGGGDAPGLNGIIESASRCLLKAGCELVGILDGFEGVFNGKTKPITLKDIEGIHYNAGTYLGTSNRSNLAGREAEFLQKFKLLGAEGLIAAGGDGTFAALSRVGEGLPLLGVPKTIDNDLAGTEITFGYDTACSVVAEAVDALRATADAHRRVMVVEAMGRTAGWIALGGGMASYADIILIPERPYSRAELLAFIRQKQTEGRRGLLICVAEGASAQGEKPQVAFTVKESAQTERFGGVSERLARWIEQETGWEARHVVLGHLQRSAHPTTTDRFLTLAMGVEVARLALARQWGQAVVYRQGQVVHAPIQDLMAPARLVTHDHRWVRMVQAVGLFI